MKYKALSLKQPIANWVMEGRKTIETRKWTTQYRGDIVICSSQHPHIQPAGCALGVVELYHIEPMKREHEKRACVKKYTRANSWFIRNVRRFQRPIPVKGRLGLFDLELKSAELEKIRLEA